MLKLGFLHTAFAHEATFSRLLESRCAERAITPAVASVAVVAPELLSAASRHGVTEALRSDVTSALDTLAANGVTDIVCTCSTLGDFVEGMRVGDVPVHRIDRAAADECMKFDKVLVLAALDSAAKAADRLLGQSRLKAGSTTHWDVATVPDAWSHFAEGRMSDYANAVACFADEAGGPYDAVFLSQASMYEAKQLCSHPIILTTPDSGLDALLMVSHP